MSQVVPRVEALRRVDALIGLGLRLARSAPSGRILLARVHGAIDPAWVPRPWGDDFAQELESAHQAALEPLPMRAVERVLRDAWGTQPTDELDGLEPEPAAVTPSSQVHRGSLDGAAVAVKVLRPGLRASVRQDLALLEGLLSPLGAAFPSLDAAAVMREFRERVLDELDLEHEAVVQRRFHRALRNHPFLTVPAPVTRLSHENVLVSGWIEGEPLWHAADSDEASARLLVFVLGGIRSGYVHADPDPDDVRVLSDGRLAVLDFGATRAVAPERAAGAAAALEAFVEDDAAALGASFEQLGWLPSGHAAAALALAREVLGELAGPAAVRLDSDAVLGARDRLIDRPAQVVELILVGALPPEDLWPARAAAQLFATIARVGASGRWRELARAALREGWAAPAAMG